MVAAERNQDADFNNSYILVQKLKLRRNYKMKTIYGVKINTPINQKLKNGQTMYDWIVRKNCYPAFCMRTLCGENKVTAKEIDFLKSKHCKIGFVLNGLTEAEVSGANGVGSAEKAMEAVLELGVPANIDVVIFAEIQPKWSVNHNWMISFAQALKIRGFIAGFIGNTDSSQNFNFDRQASHFAEFTENVNYLDAVFMATEPKQTGLLEKWTPYCPSAIRIEDVSFWGCSETCFDEINADNVYAKDEIALANLW